MTHQEYKAQRLALIDRLKSLEAKTVHDPMFSDLIKLSEKRKRIVLDQIYELDRKNTHYLTIKPKNYSI